MTDFVEVTITESFGSDSSAITERRCSGDECFTVSIALPLINALRARHTDEEVVMILAVAAHKMLGLGLVEDEKFLSFCESAKALSNAE